MKAAIDTSVAVPTVKIPRALRPVARLVAVTATTPSPTPVAPPADATVAMAPLLVLQVTEEGSSANRVPSLKVPVAT